MYKYRRLYLAGLLLCSASTSADMGLEDVVSIVLAENLSILIKNEQLRRSEAAIRQENEKFDWTLSANIGYQHLYIPESRNGFLTTDTDSDDVLSSQLGLTKQLRNGMSINPRFEFFESDDDTSEVLSQTINRGRLSLNIPMMRGAGEKITTSGVRSASALFDAVKNERDDKLSAVTINAVFAYWQCIYAKEKYESLIRSFAHAQAFADILKERAENAQLAPTAYRKVEADLFLKKLEINRSKLELTATRRELAYLLNLNFESDDDLPKPQGYFPEISSDSRILALDQKKLLKLAFRKRLDLKALGNKQRSNMIRLEASRDQLQPKLDLLLDTDRIVLQYEKTLGGNGSSGSILSDQTEVNEISLHIRKLRKIIHRDILYALDAIQTAMENIRHAQDSVNLYESMALATKNKILIGEADQAEFSEIQGRVDNSNIILLGARKEYVRNVALLRLATGTIGLDENIRPQEISTRFLSLKDLERY